MSTISKDPVENLSNLALFIANDVRSAMTASLVTSVARLLAALKKICAEGCHARVLTNDDGGEITPKVIKLAIMKVEKTSGLKQTGRLHILRHSFCSHLAGANVPLIAIAGLARHSDLHVTQRYMHLAPTALRQAVDMLVKSRALGGVPVVPDDERVA